MGDKKKTEPPGQENAADPIAAADTLKIERKPGKCDEQLLAELAMSPLIRNTICAKSYAAPCFTGKPPDMQAALEVMAVLAGDVREGNLVKLTDILTAQAVTLDAMFTEFSRRSLLNAGQYLNASKDYANIALKAQANCRTTVEALSKIKRGGNQTVKVVHVHEGAQAVVADTFNQGGAPVGKIKQPHAKASDASVAALPSPDEARDGVPLPCNEERPVSYARRQEPRGAGG